MSYILHAHYRPSERPAESAVLFWAESLPVRKVKRSSPRDHPFRAEAGTLNSWLGAGEHEDAEVLLPSNASGPFDSVDGTSGRRKVELRPWQVPALWLAPDEAIPVLMEWLEAERIPHGVRLGDSVRYYQKAAQLALEALAGRNLVPGLERMEGRLYSRWQPRLEGHRISQLAEAMPPVCRALNQSPTETHSEVNPAPEVLLRYFLEESCDALARAWTSATGPLREISVMDPSQPGSNPGLRWARALFGEPRPISASEAQADNLQRSHRLWMRNLSVAGDEHFRVAFRLSEPYPGPDGDSGQAGGMWSLEFLLQATDDPSLLIEADTIRDVAQALAGVRRLREPREKLLRGLGYAARLFVPLERALHRDSNTTGVPAYAELSTEEAFEFMRESAHLLEESGFGVLIPSWWTRAKSRLGLKARVSSKSYSDGEGSGMMGLSNLLDYRWELSLGGQTLTREEFETLASLKSPLVQLRGEWVRLDPEQVEKALRFFSRRDGEGELEITEALSLGLGGVEGFEGLELEEVDFEDGLGEWFERLSGERTLETLSAPENLQAELRPYQRTGYSWLDFLRAGGLGSCLADDMGLGKTLQTLALLSLDQQQGKLQAPALIVCPTSVVGNWQKEAERFTPDLRVLVHQGAQRSQGEGFAAQLQSTDLVVTSYALLRRDAELLGSVDWHGAILDEAQNIKNPDAQQSRVAYGLRSGFRVALTGTPVENRLGELWSIMRFLNPGYLGSQKEFRRRFSRPIEREGDEEALGRLRKLTSPLVLRRLKSDPEVITDLPEKQESKVYCHLTEEQASLYEAVVRGAMAELDESEGIQRKGLVLSMLTSLKQISNHPAQFLHEGRIVSETGEIERSGKLARLFELLEETEGVGDRSLIFTQYAEMGEMLHHAFSERFDTGSRPTVQFVHGGTPAKKRTEMVRSFQEDEDGPQVFVLSLKAGGTGLNLTRASHVFHFDRWWNPAVEDQATDRAFRIGQKRNVQVHKFVATGTLEERIDQMSEHKKELAESVVGVEGSDEAWITELSNDTLREMVSLRREALA